MVEGDAANNALLEDTSGAAQQDHINIVDASVSMAPRKEALLSRLGQRCE